MPDREYSPAQFPLSDLRFTHPERRYPALGDKALAKMFGLNRHDYMEARLEFARNARDAATQLLRDPGFAAGVDRLPIASVDTVVGLGDGLTDDYQSWLEILNHLLLQRRPEDDVRIVNAGVSGDTTAQMVSRFAAVAAQRPDWIICLAGTHDACRYDGTPLPLASLAETVKNFGMLRDLARARTGAHWIWITPPPVIEEQIARDPSFASQGARWTNRDIAAVGHAMHRFGDPVVDLSAAFGSPPGPELFHSDGLHPSLAGQRAIITTLVQQPGVWERTA